MREQESNRSVSTGTCNLCGLTVAKSGMTRHLSSCYEKRAASEIPQTGSKASKGLVFRIVVSGRGLPEYWMHLEVPASAKLTVLDRFLRDIWLECCGHLSTFRIEGVGYYSSGAREMNGRSMNFQIERLLEPGVTFRHEYDFGATTELDLKVVGEREGLTDGKSIKVLARNNPPERKCQSCGQPATQVCSQCTWEGEGWVCDDCAEDHKCGEEMLLPVVNSPRVGMCGYIG